MNSHSKKFWSLILIAALLFAVLLPGCSKRKDLSDSASVSETSETDGFDTSPHKKADGSRYRIAYIDYDEYVPASRQFYYILMGLEELGWLTLDDMPYTIHNIESNNISTEQICDMLQKKDLGEYIEFAEDAFYYLAYDDSREIADALRERAGKDIDMVITFGTSAGLFVKELDLPVPMIDFSATDPVASGIIESSTEGSGDPDVWANVEPSVPARQLRYYHSIKPFDRLGVIIYGDETISGVPDIEASAEDLGFELVKYNIKEQSRESDEELEAYYKLVESRIRKMSKEDIDAFFLTIDLINDLDRLPHLLSYFYKKGIPVYLMDDMEAVRSGGMLLIQANDPENVGRFTADAIAKVLNGAVAGDLPCRYTSSPSIYLNYDVAREIGYPVKFEFLTACDGIFTEGSGNE